MRCRQEERGERVGREEVEMGGETSEMEARRGEGRSRGERRGEERTGGESRDAKRRGE